MTGRKLVSRLVSLIGRRSIAWLVIAIVGSLVLAVVELGVAIFLQLFLKSIGLLNQEVRTSTLFGHWVPSAGALATALCTLAFARAVAQLFVGQSAVVAQETISARLRRIAVWEMLLHPSKTFVSAAATNARIGELSSKASLFCYAGSSLGAGTVQALALIAVMFVMARGETAIALVGLGLMGLIVLRMNRFTRRVSANVPSELRVLTSGIERVSRNTTLVRVLRTETIEHRRLVTSIDAYAGHLERAGFIGAFATAITPFAGVLLLLIIVATSQVLLHTPSITLISFLYLFVRFVQAVAISVFHFSSCNAAWPSFKDSLDYVATFRSGEIESATRVGEALVGSVVERTYSEGGEPPAIAVRAVSFAYPGATREVLDDLSVNVDPGCQLAIVGPSGCGKSTLLGLILGLFVPTRGEIRIGTRVPAEFFDSPNVRVGYVGSDAFLIAGTIRDNLRYGLSTPAIDRDLWDALARARLLTTVEDLPGRLDYRVAEDGSGLSAGQRQRLCLARAILNRPHLLVLDEVSANLDANTEREITESLKDLRGKCTTIIVSHREAILEYADQIIALGQSVVSEGVPRPPDAPLAKGISPRAPSPSSKAS